MEEADRADRVAIIAKGLVVAEGTPEGLRGEIGDGEVISLEVADPLAAIETLRDAHGVGAVAIRTGVRILAGASRHLFAAILDTLGDAVTSATLSRPGLDDVFLHRTGHTFWDAAQTDVPAKGRT
jgi:ABC-2 type transport system ATP-binding protein